jgi:DNA-binding transcriptional regulator YiaG
MSDKILGNFLYEGLGFPIELHNVEMRAFGSEYHPVIDVKKVADSAMQALSTQESTFTGDQVMFMRTYLKKDTSEFAKLIHSSEQDVTKWESCADKTIDMNLQSENLLKQHIINYFKINNEKENTPAKLLASKSIFSSPQKPPSESSDKPTEQKSANNKKKKN